MCYLGARCIYLTFSHHCTTLPHTANPLPIAHTHRMYKGVHTCMYESIHAHTRANMAHIHEHAYIHVHTDMQACIHHMDTRHSPSCTNPVPLITQTHVDTYIHKTSHICMHVPTLTRSLLLTHNTGTLRHTYYTCACTHTHTTHAPHVHTHMYTHTIPRTFTNHISH